MPMALRDGFGEIDQGGFRGTVGHGAGGVAALTRPARHIDNPAAAIGAKMLDGELRQIDRRQKIDSHFAGPDLLPFVHWRVDRDLRADASVVDQARQRAGGCDGLIPQLLWTDWIRKIGRYSPAPAIQHLHQRLCGIAIAAIVDDDIRAVRSKSAANRLPDGASRAGDEDGLFSKFHSSPTCGPQVSDIANPC